MDTAEFDPRLSGRLSRGRRLFRALRPHWPLAVVLVPAAALRLVVLLVYHPAFLFWRDSYEYLNASRDFRPPVTRTLGYPLLLRALGVTGAGDSTLGLVPIVQHLLGLALGIGIYAILRRRGLAAGWSALAAAPVLLDGYQLDIEQFILSETLFSALLLLALGLVLTGRAVGPRRAIALGLVVSAVVLTRSVGLPLILLFGAYLLLRRVGWRPVVGFLAAAVLPVLAYAVWFDAVHQSFGLQLMSGRLLYGKTAQFADCARLPASEQSLCPRLPVARRGGQNFWSFTPPSPQSRYPYTRQGDRTLGHFAHVVIVRQPGGYAHVVAADLVHYAGPTRQPRRRDQRLVTWRFPTQPTPRYTVAVAGRSGWRNGHLADPTPGGGAAFLHGYQHVALPGLGLALCGVVCVGGAVLRPKRPDAVRWLRLDCALLASIGAALVVVPAFTVALDYRFLLPELVVLPLGAALALSGRPFSRSARPRTRRSPEEPPEPATTGAGIAA